MKQIYTTKQIFDTMTLLVENENIHWQDKWEVFWSLNNLIPDNIDWCDPDCGYDDILARYNAIK